jgi:hypothetical protein
MKRNKIYILRCSFLLALIAMVFACKKLDEQPISSVTPENYGNSVLQIEAAYAGSIYGITGQAMDTPMALS